jgi:hypothetical protein
VGSKGPLPPSLASPAFFASRPPTRLTTGRSPWVSQLVALDGKPIESLHELQDNGQYVALGLTRYKHLPYFDPQGFLHANTSPSLNPYVHSTCGAAVS